MSISKDIELKLKARLEASDAISQAESVGAQIAGGIERAFEGVGERIVQKILASFQQGFAGFNIGGMTGGGAGYNPSTGSNSYTQNPSGIWVDNSQPITAKTTAGVTPGHTNVREDNLTGAFGAATGGAAASPDARLNALRESVGFGNGNGAGTSGSASATKQRMFGAEMFGQRRVLSIEEQKFETMSQRISAVQRLRKIDPDHTWGDPYSKEDIADAKTRQTGSISNQLDKIDKLSAAITRLTEKVEKDTETRKSLESKSVRTPEEEKQLKSMYSKEELLFKRIDQRDEEQGKIRRYEDRAKIFDNETKHLTPEAEAGPLAWYQNKSTLGRIGGAAAAVSAVGAFASEVPTMYRRYKAGSAQVDRFNTRDYSEHNYEGILATAMAGGEDSLKSESGWMTGLKAGSKIIGGGLGALVTGIGAAGAGATGVGIPLGIGLGAASAGLAGVAMSGASDLFNFQQRRADYMKQQQGLKMMENKEFMGMYNASSGLAKESYSQSLSMGSDRFSNFLYGGGENGILDQSKGFGLSYSQLLGNQQRFANGMGTVVNGQLNLNAPSAQGSLVTLNRMMAEGKYNAPEVASAMYQGGVQQANRSEQVNDAVAKSAGLMDRISNSGMSEEIAPRLFDRFAAEGSGIGAASMAEYNLKNVVSGAQQAGGMDLTSSAAMNLRASAQSNFMSQFGTGAGPQGAAKMMSVQKLEREFKKKTGRSFTEGERTNILLNNLDSGYVEHITQGKIKGEDAQNMVNSFNDNIKENFNTMASRRTGSREVAGYIAAKDAGSQTTSQGEIIKSALTSTGTTIKGNQGPVVPREAAAGKAEATLDAKIDVTKTASGFQTLNQVINTLNAGLPTFVQNFQNLATAMNGSNAPKKPTKDASIKH